jgi:hypothetical protein
MRSFTRLRRLFVPGWTVDDYLAEVRAHLTLAYQKGGTKSLDACECRDHYARARQMLVCATYCRGRRRLP